MCFVWIAKKTATFALYSTIRLVLYNRDGESERNLPVVLLWEAIHLRRKGKLHRDRSPHTTARRSRQLSHKKLIRQDATDPKQKAVTDYKEQVDRHTPHSNPIHRKTKKQENQHNHDGHNNQKPNQ